MAVILKIGFVAILFACLSMQVSSANNTNCFQQKCRECPDSAAAGPGDQVKCELRSLVSLSWLDDVPDKFLPGPGNIQVDYTCIKLVASDPTVQGDSTDVIRGCVLSAQAKSVCDSLIGAELVKGKKDARCTFCTGDYCNSAAVQQVSVVALLMVLAKIINH